TRRERTRDDAGSKERPTTGRPEGLRYGRTEPEPGTLNPEPAANWQLATGNWLLSAALGDPRRHERVLLVFVRLRLGGVFRGLHRISPPRRRDAEQVLDEEVPPLVIAVRAARRVVRAWDFEQIEAFVVLDELIDDL